MGCTTVSQTQGIDCGEIFAFIIKSQNYKAIFAFAGARDWELGEIDVAATIPFQYLGLEDCIGRVCKFQKALYGLKQAARAFDKKRIEQLVRKSGYLPFNSDWDVSSRLGRDVGVLIASSLHIGIHSAKHILKSNFQMAELGPWTYTWE